VPGDIAPKGLEAETHIGLVERAPDGADGGEGLQAVLAAQGVARRVEAIGRIIDDPVAGLDATQRRGLAVADLHETRAAPDLDMFGGCDRQPVPAHGILLDRGEPILGEAAVRFCQQPSGFLRALAFAPFLPGCERQGYCNQRRAHEEIDQKRLEARG
jgi:hypothetical protein